MISEIVRWGLRLIAAVALIAMCAIITHPRAAVVKHTVKPPTPAPVQTIPVNDYAPLPRPTFDRFTVVMPPTPTPTPKATMTQAATPRKPSVANSRPAIPVWSVEAAQDYAQAQVSAAQFDCLVLLWNRESGWNYHAVNTESGAYGIPQALPGDKMGATGADWRDNYKTQVNWGLGYISDRYGSSCAAWAHSNATGWY